MTALALHHHPDGWEIRRYGVAALAIVLLHVAVIAAALVWYQRPGSVGAAIPAILLDLGPPPPAAPQLQPEDYKPGPVMQEAEAPQPEPPQTEMIEQLPPAPLQEKPVVAAPQKVEPKPQPAPAKPQPVKDVKKPIKKRLAEESTTSRADRIAPDAHLASSGASAAAAAASYRGMLVAHLQRFKQFPSGAASNEQGLVQVGFTVTRNGRVTSSRVVRSSGFASIDRAALEMLQRAQPLPSFPPEMHQASDSFTAPVNFTRPR
jgi:periplasmic protein TonB